MDECKVLQVVLTRIFRLHITNMT